MTEGKEGYQPSEEEIEKAENMMTDKEQVGSKVREAMKKAPNILLNKWQGEKREDIKGLLKELSELPFELLDNTSRDQESFLATVYQNWARQHFSTERVGLPAPMRDTFEDKDKFIMKSEVVMPALFFAGMMEPSQSEQEIAHRIEESGVTDPNEIEELTRWVQLEPRYCSLDFGVGDETENREVIITSLESVGDWLSNQGLPFNETYGRSLYDLAFNSTASMFRPADPDVLINRRADQMLEAVDVYSSDSAPSRRRIDQEKANDYRKKIEIAKKMLLAAQKARAIAGGAMNLFR